MKTVDQIIFKVGFKTAAMIKALTTLSDEDHDTFQKAREDFYQAIMDMAALHDEFYPHEERIKKEAQVDNPDKEQGHEDAHQFSDEYRQ